MIAVSFVYILMFSNGKIYVGNGKARQYARLHGRPFTEIEFKKNGGIRVISPA